MSGPVRVAYDALIAANELKPDRAQANAVAALDRLAANARSKGLWSRLFGANSEGPLGVYLWGGVGRGKSMLMDLGFDRIDIGGGIVAIFGIGAEAGGSTGRRLGKFDI